MKRNVTWGKTRCQSRGDFEPIPCRHCLLHHPWAVLPHVCQKCQTIRRRNSSRHPQCSPWRLCLLCHRAEDGGGLGCMGWVDELSVGKPTPWFDLCDIHLINFSTHSLRGYTKGGCQLPPQCVQRYEGKKYRGRFNSGRAIFAENTDRLLQLVAAKFCRDVTVKSMRRTMTCGDKCLPAQCRGLFTRGLSLVWRILWNVTEPIWICP